MAGQTVGLLHPGEMGAAVGAVLRGQGRRVVWASDGRSAETRGRAGEAGLEDAGSLEELVRQSEVILSVCPPHAAREVARSVAGFEGVFVDANAVAPATARELSEAVTSGGGEFVDGGIVGPPPRSAGTTRLYLSGSAAAGVDDLFAGSAVDARVVSDEVGAASAVKMAYAAWTKGTAALLIAIRELARAEQVEPVLLEEWRARRSRSSSSAPSGPSGRARRRVGGGSARWRRSPRPSPQPGSQEASTRRPPRCFERSPPSIQSNEHAPERTGPPGRPTVRREGLPRHLDRRSRRGDWRAEGLALRAHQLEAGPALRDDGRRRPCVSRGARRDSGRGAGDGKDPAGLALAPSSGRGPARRCHGLCPGVALPRG